MPRRVEDIIRTDRRSIRDIPSEIEPKPKPTRKEASAAKAADAGREVRLHRLDVSVPIHAVSRPPRDHRQTRRPGWWLSVTAMVVLLVAAGGYFASVHFSRAVFKIVPNSFSHTADTVIVSTGTSTPGYLMYRAVPYEASAQAVVPAKSGPILSIKASGTVTISNSYSRSPQPLLAGTRLITDTGLVYRLKGTVTVPGYKVGPTGSIVPGTIQAPVVADAAGSEYNLARSEAGTLRILAYKDTPRYAAFSAKLATDITGGFAGEKKTVNPVVLASTTETLRAGLVTSLLALAKQDVPEGYIMYDGAYKATYYDPTLSGTTTDKATVTARVLLHAIYFKKDELVIKLVGAERTSTFKTYPFRSIGLETLSFSINNPKEFSPTRNTALIARFKGDLRLVGIIPEADLKSKFAGLSLSDAANKFGEYAAVMDVRKSTAELFPSWATGVPSDPDRIKIEVVDR